MIRHIVLVKFRAEVGEPQIATLFDDLRAICARLPGCLGVTAGRSESPEQMERGYLHGFVADFADWAALAAYQADPGHQAFGVGLVAHAVGGIDGILVVDLAVGGST